MADNVTVIEAGRAARHYWLDLWRHRELFRVLAWRDLPAGYKQTVIGVLWALIRPFLTMLVFTVIFSRIAKLPADGDPAYALMVFAGILITLIRFWPHWQIVVLPVFAILAFLVSVGPALWTSSLNVKYRDFHYVHTIYCSVRLVFPVRFSLNVVPRNGVSCPT